MEQAFWGSGMKFPPQINKATGRFAVSDGRQSIKEAIYLILMTQKTERFMRPQFGSNIAKYTFMNTNSSMLTLMARDLREDIMSQEPRVANVEVNMNSEIKEGCLLVSIDYTIINGNVRDNLVFPFYLNGENETEGDVMDEEQDI